MASKIKISKPPKSKQNNNGSWTVTVGGKKTSGTKSMRTKKKK